MPPNNSSNDLLNDVGVDDDVDEVTALVVPFTNGSLNCSALLLPAGDDEEVADIVGENTVEVAGIGILVSKV